MSRANILIMGAAGRDFHNFNLCFRNNQGFRVVAFTAAQIPGIAGRRYPPSLSGPLYPKGIPIHHEEILEELIDKHRINQVVFSYSDISHAELMHKASRVLAHGADFRLMGPAATMLKSKRPVISVCAVRTGCGKSQLTRYIAGIINNMGLKPVVVRHPMPYGNLATQAVERFGDLEDLNFYQCTIEEREEFEPLLDNGVTLFAGIDYARILRAAEKEGDVIIWDGGNNDLPFFRPDMEITIADPLRAGDETAYYPGEVNLRRAAIVVINKINAAAPGQIEAVASAVSALNPAARIIKTISSVTMADPAAVRGKRALVIEDGPTITHGGLSSGAGLAAAKSFGALEAVDPRKYAVGSISEAFHIYPHIGPVLPALGYSAGQVEELRLTIEATPCDIVLSATPIDLGRLLELSKPIERVFYQIEEEPGAPLALLVTKFLAKRFHA